MLFRSYNIRNSSYNYIVKCSLLFLIVDAVSIDVLHTVCARYCGTAQRISPRSNALSSILLRGRAEIFFWNLLALFGGLGNSSSWYNCSRLHVRHFCGTYLRHIRCNRVRSRIIRQNACPSFVIWYLMSADFVLRNYFQMLRT